VARWVPAVRAPAWAVDAALAVAVTAFVVVTEISERRHNEHVPTSGVLLLLCLAPALAIRRRFPGTALAMVAAIQGGLWLTGTAPGANVPAELIAPYSAAAYSRSGAQLLDLLRRSVREFGQTVVMVTHDPVAASYADDAVFLADGRVVGREAEPTPQRVLDRMTSLGVDRCCARACGPCCRTRCGWC
jgi:hypothetical protein